MDIFVVLAFVLGTGFGWCLCSAFEIVDNYLEDRRLDEVSNRNWKNLSTYLTHRMVRDNYTGEIHWVKDNQKGNKDGHKNAS